MTKFILIAFGFLGFAFYELSGGADFDGEALRLTRVDATPLKQGLPKIATADVQKLAPKNDTLVTRASFNLASNDNVEAAIKPPTEVTQASFEIAQDDENTSAIILPSLISQSGVSVEDAVSLISSDQDFRVVTGNLVNVRGGPGTNFDVVGKLTLGTEVEILAENGEGWVEMRSSDGATVGWMADFLLEKG